MRVCQSCNTPDIPVLEFDGDCRGKCDKRADERIETHEPACPAISHKVIAYPRKLLKDDLVYDVIRDAEGSPKSVARDMAPKWKRSGWQLKIDGPNYLRWKMLCRDCIEIEVQRSRNHSDYLKACEALRPSRPQSYFDLLNSVS